MRNTDIRQEITRSLVISEARRWVGTPYRHQARLLGVGVDCVGLIVGVGTACDVLPWSEEAFAPFAGYARLPNPGKMREAMGRFLVPVPAAEVQRGDVAWFAWRDGLPMHLAILSRRDRRLTMIHATSQIGKVVEHGFADPWPRRVDSWWRYPGLVQG